MMFLTIALLGGLLFLVPERHQKNLWRLRDFCWASTLRERSEVLSLGIVQLAAAVMIQNGMSGLSAFEVLCFGGWGIYWILAQRLRVGRPFLVSGWFLSSVVFMMQQNGGFFVQAFWLSALWIAAFIFEIVFRALAENLHGSRSRMPPISLLAMGMAIFLFALENFPSLQAWIKIFGS